MNEALLGRTDAPFQQWQRKLIYEKKLYKNRPALGEAAREAARAHQDALGGAVRGGRHALGQYLREQLELDSGQTINAPVFPRPVITAAEFLNPPIPLEQELGEAWARDISPSWASRPAFWLLCLIEWIEQGRMGSGDLTEHLLAGPGDQSPEGQTRRFLRRTGGIPIVRGKVSVFSDCTLARAWWRYRLSSEIAEHTGGRFPSIAAHKVLHVSGRAWERLVLLSIRRLTVINHPRARAAIVSALHRQLRQGRLDEQYVIQIATAVARIGLRSSLGHINEDALGDAAA